MANQSPAVIIKDILNGVVGNFPADAGLGWGIVVGVVPAMAATAQQISIADTGGLDPNPRWALDFPSVQIMVRGAVGDYPGAYAKAKQIKDVLLGIDATVVGDDRVDGITMQGDINIVGYDEKARPMFSLNFQLILEPGISGDSNRQAL